MERIAQLRRDLLYAPDPNQPRTPVTPLTPMRSDEDTDGGDEDAPEMLPYGRIIQITGQLAFTIHRDKRQTRSGGLQVAGWRLGVGVWRLGVMVGVWAYGLGGLGREFGSELIMGPHRGAHTVIRTLKPKP